MKIILAFLIGVMCGVYLADAVLEGEAGPPQIPNGHYRIYNLQEAFDTKTGEPIYWLIADLVKWKQFEANKVPVHQSKIRFYQIPRRAVMNLPDDEKPCKRVSFLLTVNDGKAKIDKAIFPPTVFTR